jgi:hypothetical protein
MPSTSSIHEPPTLVEQAHQRRSLWRWAAIGSIVFLLFLLIYWGFFAQVPTDHPTPADHFLYGSIGSDADSGLPYWVWAVLPEMFPEHLPEPQRFRDLPESERTGLAGYAQFGFLFEDGADRPVGFSKRRLYVDRVGLNCAVCHVGTLRVTEGVDPQRIYGSQPRYASGARDRVFVLGMPAITVDLQKYASFLHRCAADDRFTADGVLAHIDARTKLGLIERFAYRQAIPLVREALLRQRAALSFMASVPEWGPGRVDTFNPYKAQFLGSPWDGTLGTADLPALWNQRPREGMQLHWDGNNTSVFERNLSASLGAGATPASVDLPRLRRVAAWTGSPLGEPLTPDQIAAEREKPTPHEGELTIPRFPFRIDEKLAGEGARLYADGCASCHGWKGKYVGTVEPLEKIGTDPERLRSYTPELAMLQNTLGAGQPWRFNHFRKTDGYANQPLDGLWARAPYLHNGSVPTLADLLDLPAKRPKAFFRGDDEYDPVKVGFRSDRDRSADGRRLFRFDTTQRGNDKGGHVYGTELSADRKRALLEYLKTL